MTVLVELVAAAGLSAAVVLTLHCPVVRSEPVFTTINVAVIAALITLGSTYAHTRRGDINVITDGRTIDVIVHDYGIGGASDYEQGGVGGMRCRVEELGG